MADLALSGGIVVHSNDWSGDGKIYGTMSKTVSAVTSPTRRRVDLYKNARSGQTGRIIATTYSRESDGYYEFSYLKIDPDTSVYDYAVVLLDWPASSIVQESKIARWVRPVAM